ncbi:MAG: PIN domain-containing protein [Nanoarchaeota archaeon]
MNIKIFFCDTYALIEIIGGNKNYKKYTGYLLITSDYNLMELYYAFLRDYGKEKAEHYFNEWSEFTVKIPRYIIKEGMEIKFGNKKENLSYVDCICYAFALENDIMFLTGDSKFENKKGVEFVK